MKWVFEWDRSVKSLHGKLADKWKPSTNEIDRFYLLIYRFKSLDLSIAICTRTLAVRHHRTIIESNQIDESLTWDILIQLIWNNRLFKPIHSWTTHVPIILIKMFSKSLIVFKNVIFKWISSYIFRWKLCEKNFKSHFL